MSAIAVFSPSGFDTFIESLLASFGKCGITASAHKCPDGDRLQCSSALNTVLADPSKGKKPAVVVIDDEASVRVAEMIGARGICFPIVTAYGFHLWTGRPLLQRERLAPQHFRKVFMVRLTPGDTFDGCTRAFWCSGGDCMEMDGFRWDEKTMHTVSSSIKDAVTRSAFVC